MDIKVGDIVMVNTGERVPADLVLAYTTDKSSTVFVKTDQLDGETDWKVRRPINQTQSKMNVPEDLVQKEHAEIRCELPSNLIYEFNGIYYDKDEDGNEYKEALSMENTLWANTILASQGFILGVVVYTGRQTRS